METAKNITEVPANGGTDSTTLDNLRQNIDSQKNMKQILGMIQMAILLLQELLNNNKEEKVEKKFKKNSKKVLTLKIKHGNI